MFFRALAAIAALLLVSCGFAGLPMPDISPYRIEIQQGNFVSPDMVAQLKIGMSKDQVRFVMGTALITDSFHADRWDYVFRRQKANSRELEQRKLALFFDDGKLTRIEGDMTPAPGTDAGTIKTPETQPVPAAATPAAAQTAAEAPVPTPAAAQEKSAAAPAPPADGNVSEKAGENN